MKVCFVIPTLTSGGSERVVSLLANYWAENGHQVSILILDSNEQIFYPLHTKVNLRSIQLFDKPSSYIKKAFVTLIQIKRLRKQFKQIHPDAIISFIDIATLLSAISLLGLKIPLIVSERNNPRKNKVNKYLKLLNRKFSFRLADAIVLQTSAVKTSFPSAFSSKMHIIPNPIIPAPLKWSSDHETNTIISVGRLEHQKGYDILLKAFSLFHKINPEWKLVIIGHGSEFESLELLANQLKIQNNVKWYGRTSNVYKQLSLADIFILSSRYEGFPNALCEAMSCGMPVISTNCEFGPSELIENYKNGILVPIEDHETIWEAMNYLVTNADERKKLGKHASEINKKYSIKDISGNWESLIRNVKY